LDLVEVSAKSKPHVCRVMDYGQYKYELAKKQKEAKKKQKMIVVKEIKLRPRIEQHDYDFKLDHAIKFLGHGDKVKFILQFRGRENAHKELGRVVLDRVISDLVEHGLVEQEPRTEGRFMNMTLAPLTPAQKKKIKDELKPVARNEVPFSTFIESVIPAELLPSAEENGSLDEDYSDDTDDTDDTDVDDTVDSEYDD